MMLRENSCTLALWVLVPCGGQATMYAEALVMTQAVKYWKNLQTDQGFVSK